MAAVNKTETISAADFRARNTQKVSAAPAPVVHRPVMWVGIDPGTCTGFALWEPASKAFIEVATYTAVEAVCRLRLLSGQFGFGALRVRIENPAGNKPTFGKDVAGAKMREKISQNVGSNKRDAQLMMEWLEHLGICYEALTPRKKATGAGKVTAEFFKGVAGFPVRSSQHARDAAALIIGL